MIIDPAKLSRRDNYNFLVSAIAPRPIAFVTTINPENVVNAAPFSFFNAVSGAPPIIMISAGRKEGAMKHTAENILKRKEFVVNLVTEDLVHSMNVASADFPSEVSEIEFAKLTLLPGDVVSIPRIGESPVNCECVLVQHLLVGDATDLILGEIVRYHVGDELMTDGRLDQQKFRPVARMGGNFYSRSTDLFELERYKYEGKKEGKN